MAKDYYDILGVSKTASKDEIKKAFHKLAHQHHPDKSGGDDKKFKEANEAYQTLSNDQKRAQYDQFGHAGAQGGFDPNQQGGFGGFGGFDFSQGGANFDMGDLGDIFGDFFGGSGGGRGRENRGRDIATEINISFYDSIFGGEKTITLSKVSKCDICKGTGGKHGTKMKKCSTCNGQGKVQEMKRSFFGSFAQVRTCDTCHGTGEIPEEKCSTCKGAGVYKRQEDIKLVIPAGVNNGESLRVAGYGEAIKGGQAGDLYIKIHVPKHNVFTREGTYLKMDLNIKLSDALLGAEYEIETLDGKITVKIPEGINHGEVIRVRDQGVVISKSKRGDLLIKLNVKLPSKLSREEKELVQKLKEKGM